MAKEVSRTEFLKLAGYRVATIGAAIGFGSQVGRIFSSEKEEKVESHAEHHTSGLEWAINTAGSGNFFTNIRSLVKTQNLTWYGYPAVLGLNAAKYAATDDIGKHHLEKEWRDVFDALTIILGTTILGDGAQMDLDKIIQSKRGEDSTLEEKVFMLATLSPLVSSGLTTVGNSTVFRGEVDRLVHELAVHYGAKLQDQGKPGAIAMKMVESLKKDLYADLISHVSDNSGFMCFGDPPFIAMLQKYGSAGFYYQNKTMWAPMLYSSLRIVHKLKKRIRQAMPDAYFSDTDDKILFTTKYLPLIASVVTESVFNVGKYFYNTFSNTPGEVVEQSPGGVQINVMGTAERSIASLSGFGGKYLSDFITAFAKRDIRKLGRMMSARGVKDRLHSAVGENLADVLSIFPFQGLSIPFLQPLFMEGLHAVEKLNLPEWLYEGIVYTLIGGFSTVADNYVGCKIGLELLPHKPEIPLIASIVGGSILPPGNMANLTLVDQSRYGMDDALKWRRLAQHADMAVGGFLYSQAIPHLRKLPGIGALYDKSGIFRALEVADAKMAPYRSNVA